MPLLYGWQPKNNGETPKMDGENNGSKPYEQMDVLGGFHPIFGSTPIRSVTPQVTVVFFVIWRTRVSEPTDSPAPRRLFASSKPVVEMENVSSFQTVEKTP